MTFRTLIRRSLRFHWRAHLGVVLGAAVGSAALVGALVVGDSVKGSLREQALDRVGNTWAAMSTGDRFVTAGLVEQMCEVASNRYKINLTPPPGVAATWSPPGQKGAAWAVLIVPATISREDGSRRVNGASVLGVDSFATNAFPQMSAEFSELDSGGLLINAALAQQLNVRAGDEVLLRVSKPAPFSREAAIVSRAAETAALRLKVTGILRSFPANLSVQARPGAVLNAFLPKSRLAKEIGLGDQVNLLLAQPAFHVRAMTRWQKFMVDLRMWRRGQRPNPWQSLRQPVNTMIGIPASSQESAAATSEILTHSWTLADAQCELHAAPSTNLVELKTSRIFFDPLIVRATLAADTNAQPILTYLVNLLRAGTNTTPYSMVTAAGPPWTPADMRDDEILVSQWLADDLQVKPGDEIALTYFDPESGARLAEHTNTFRVHSIVPMEMPWADRTLMPDFPGIEKAEKTSEWDAGFPLVHKIRQKDEDYWKQHRGTPKAFVTLAAGKKMWGNRFGELTAIRFPIPKNPGGASSTSSQTSEKNGDAVERVPPSLEAFREGLEKKILANLKPEELGLRFEPVREQALKAAEQSQDFGQLFLGFSFFLIIAALLLMALLFSFGLEQRAPEIGTLLALGFTPEQVRRLLLREGTSLAFIGGVLGAIGGLAFARALLQGLTTIWRDAVGAAALSFHFTAQTLIIGLLASVTMSAITIWLTLRKFVRRPATELLSGEIGTAETKFKGLKPKVFAIASLLAGLSLIGWAMFTGDTPNAGIFFGAGALALVAGLSFANAWLAGKTGVAPVSNSSALSDGDRRDAVPTLASLGVRGCARRRRRSLATVAMLASGSFLIISIGVFRLDANRDATKRSSGTGGFAFLGETTMPVVHDLNSLSGRDFFALNERDLQGVSFVPFRMREGDEASCLNLNSAQKPRLLGVKPEMLEGRFTFAKGVHWTSLVNTGLRLGESAASESGNRLNGFPRESTNDTGLKSGVNEIEIPAIGDANSIQWAMHKKVGDTIDYVDERGQAFKVRIVGAVANSILQGSLIIDETEFMKRFPNESGYRMFLVDAPSNSVPAVSATLSRALQDVGLEVTPAAQRLAQFNAVQNTYLGTFQVLGGLGLLLGSVGLGIVVLRNVLERRGELAVLLAVGFRARVLQRLVLIEHGVLLVVGLALGGVAAAVAVLPALLSPASQLPHASLAFTLCAVLVNGALWTWIATRLALRGNLLEALRNE